MLVVDFDSCTGFGPWFNSIRSVFTSQSRNSSPIRKSLDLVPICAIVLKLKELINRI